MNVIKFLCPVILFSFMYSNELIIGDRVYKEENGKWYNHSDGYKGDRMIMHRMIVRKADKTLPTENDFSQLGISNVEILNRLLPGDYCIIEINKNDNAIDLATIINNSNIFEYIEFDALGELYDPPNDEYYSDQWSLHDDRLQLEKAWEITTGEPSVIIGIVDSGVDYKHEDLAENIWQNLGEDIDGDGKVFEYLNGEWQFDPDDENDFDDDGNGKPDDFIGWNFNYNDEVDPNNNPLDEDGHGIKVSGIIAAKINNGVGIAGIAGGQNINQGIRIMVTRINKSEEDVWDGISIFSTLNCIIYLATNGAKIINMSWGWQGGYEFYEEILSNLINEYNVLFIAGAGHVTSPFPPHYQMGFPAKSEKVIGVTASLQDDYRWGGARYGSELSVIAPGWNIPTTTISDNHDEYVFDFGATSAAAPHVTGIAALVLSINPEMKSLDVKTLIEVTADKVPGMEGQYFHDEYGFGRVNAYRAVSMAKYMADYDISRLLSGVVDDNIYEHTLLAGEVSVPVNIKVASGVKLYLYPGTRINIEEDIKIDIEGSLIAEGNIEEPISISSENGHGGGIIFHSGSSIQLEFVDISQSGPLILQNQTSNSIIENCNFIYNDYVIIVEGSPQFINCNFSNNQVGLISVSLSNPNTIPKIENCIFENNEIAGMLSGYRSQPVLFGNTFINNSKGLSVSYGSQPFLFTNNQSCETQNNLFDENEIGVYVSNSGLPWLGIKLDNMSAFEGYNRFASNTWDVYSENTDYPIYAQMNHWQSDSNNPCESGEADVFGEVYWQPTISENSGSNIAHLAFQNEVLGDYILAASQYIALVMENPDAGIVRWAIAGLSRCYTKLNKRADLITLLEQIMQDYPETLTFQYASTHRITQLIDSGNYEEALNQILILEGLYPESELTPKHLFEEWVIAEKTGGLSRAGKSKADIEKKLIKEYAHDNFGMTMAFMQGIVPQTLDTNTESIKSNVSLTESYSLSYAYPNPFNPNVVLQYSIPEITQVTIRIYDILGREITTLVNTEQSSGTHQITWDASQLASGMYLIRFTTPEYQAVQKITLSK